MKKTDLTNLVQMYPSYEAYLEAEFDKKIPELKSREVSLRDDEQKVLSAIESNIKTIRNILATYTPGSQVAEAAKAVTEPLDIYIITENWCGSSTANLPYIVKIMENNPNFRIKIALRDSNPAFMAMYLGPTGAKSIPIVIGVDKDGNEVIKWGSRSKAEQAKRDELLPLKLEFWEMVRQMKDWYADNNRKAIEDDFTDVLSDLKKQTA